MQLTNISDIQGQIELVSGLHIGSGNAEMHIGGTDNPVIKNPVTGEPYIPGSSLKGKMRSLLEWRAGVVSIAEGKPLGFKHLPKLSGAAAQQGRAILNPSLAESTAPPPPNPGFPQQWRERFKPGQILSGGRSRVVP
ncbi:MAG: type III-A CRISPR-associated RAMP protein Csm3 [Chromatiaceae bacterium]|nr:type III-A CRISPR-associated RAMP protein Csm3 [Chromatiaceae bacterium]MBP8289075.1 type III-A CRISPR-associated RAMP protein Csm3 [Chromatiaceae bacterium]